MIRRVLVVDNDQAMLDLLQTHLAADGWTVTALTSGQDALKAMGQDDFDVILTDLVMDGLDGMALLHEARQRAPAPRVVIMTAFGSIESAIDAIRRGAYDYLTKPFRLAEASLVLQRALDDQRLREENRRLKAAVKERFGLDRIIGRSDAMQAVFEKIRAVADSDATILVIGESGTGKELVARAIHQNSGRRDSPFVAVNCAAIPENLLESELFGHERGAFTGADRKRRGLFAEANGGTVFLDEIADIPLLLQAKLLRVLQDKAVRPVGGSQEVQLNLRVISATHQDLVAMVTDGRFREDLYYRLAVIPLRLPSLRERSDDILLLAATFLTRASETLGKPLEGFDQEATAWLLRHRWPGNVRELENVVERAATLARGAHITLADLNTDFTAPPPIGSALRPTLAELEEQYIQRVLQETKGDKAAAAKILGVSIRTLQRRDR